MEKLRAGRLFKSLRPDVGAHCSLLLTERSQAGGPGGAVPHPLSVDTDSRVWRRAARSRLLMGRGADSHCRMPFHYSPTCVATR
ncbi:hypothetical protein EYF80_021735 [Liparis tanakae]|uniref:Uncharacterized protein n=1 Tax=Liparis tanakae TaxID=230148 RepID=A0A4Z2HR31_9TELE|nr:hypothetical protein EYF80_021735 [Liparis tanakae]